MRDWIVPYWFRWTGAAKLAPPPPCQGTIWPSRDTTPLVGKRVAGTEAKRLLDVSLGILGLAELNLGDAYLSVRVGQISIQFQCPLAFPDALRGAVGPGLDDAQAQMGERILGGRGTTPW